MSLNTPVREKTMPQAGIEVFIRDTFNAIRYRIWVIDDPAFEFAGETIDVAYHNRQTKKITAWQYYNLTVKQYEFLPEVLAVMKKWLDIFNTYDGVTPVVWKTETFKSSERWYAGTGSIMLELTNITATTSVTGSVDGLLTVTTDYTVTAFGSSGKHILTLISGGTITTLDQDITIVYTATPIKAVHDKPLATGTPTGFILETERNGVDSTGADMKIMNIFDDAKPSQFLESYAGDKDEKWAFNEITIKARLLDKIFVGFEA